MIRTYTLPFILALAGSVVGQTTPSVAISLGIRETGAGGGSFTNIGADGGASGGIEWVDLDTQMLPLDGTWQQLTFNLTTAPLTAFAGATANGVLDGAFGTIEHIRIRNSNGITEPITIWIDDVANTITPPAGAPTTTVFGDFEGHPNGTEVMFQEPDFSGSTAANLLPGSTSLVDNHVASRTAADRVDFQFVDNTATRWVRLTTFNTPLQANPLIRFDQQSVVTLWMRAGVAQPDLGSQGPGTAIAEMVGTGLAAGDQSTYYAAGAPANSPGAFAVSLAGQNDVPFLGGNLVSFSGFLFSVAVVADANGRMNIPFGGTAGVFDVVLQSVFLDPALPGQVTFSNALRAEFGR